MTMTKKTSKPVLRYVVQHDCTIEVARTEDGSWLLISIISSNPAENAKLAEGGDYVVWDADVAMINEGPAPLFNGLMITGQSESGAGPFDHFVEIYVPQARIEELRINRW